MQDRKSKADPIFAAGGMIHTRGSDGEQLFSKDDFFTNHRTSFVSRLAAKESLLDKDDLDENDDEVAEFESSLEDLTNEVQREVSLQHPTAFDCHNICDLVKQGKLNKFGYRDLRLTNCPRFVELLVSACSDRQESFLLENNAIFFFRISLK